MRFLALDFETGGLDPKRHGPVSLGLASFQHGKYVQGQEWAIAPKRDKDGRIVKEYDACALEISKANWTKIKNEGKPADMVLKEVSAFIRDTGHEPTDTVVAFNAPFDFAFWSELVFAAGGWNQHTRQFDQFCSPLVGPWQCARMLAMWSLEKLDRWNLDTVAGHFGFARESDAHGALEDAVLAGRIFASLTGGGGKEQTERSDSENLVKTAPVQALLEAI